MPQVPGDAPPNKRSRKESQPKTAFNAKRGLREAGQKSSSTQAGIANNEVLKRPKKTAVVSHAIRPGFVKLSQQVQFLELLYAAFSNLSKMFTDIIDPISSREIDDRLYKQVRVNFLTAVAKSSPDKLTPEFVQFSLLLIIRAYMAHGNSEHFAMQRSEVAIANIIIAVKKGNVFAVVRKCLLNADLASKQQLFDLMIAFYARYDIDDMAFCFSRIKQSILHFAELHINSLNAKAGTFHSDLITIKYNKNVVTRLRVLCKQLQLICDRYPDGGVSFFKVIFVQDPYLKRIIISAMRMYSIYNLHGNDISIFLAQIDSDIDLDPIQASEQYLMRLMQHPQQLKVYIMDLTSALSGYANAFEGYESVEEYPENIFDMAVIMQDNPFEMVCFLMNKLLRISSFSYASDISQYVPYLTKFKETVVLLAQLIIERQSSFLVQDKVTQILTDFALIEDFIKKNGANVDKYDQMFDVFSAVTCADIVDWIADPTSVSELQDGHLVHLMLIAANPVAMVIQNHLLEILEMIHIIDEQLRPSIDLILQMHPSLGLAQTFAAITYINWELFFNGIIKHKDYLLRQLAQKADKSAQMFHGLSGNRSAKKARLEADGYESDDAWHTFSEADITGLAASLVREQQDNSISQKSGATLFSSAQSVKVTEPRSGADQSMVDQFLSLLQEAGLLQIAQVLKQNIIPEWVSLYNNVVPIYNKETTQAINNIDSVDSIQGLLQKMRAHFQPVQSADDVKVLSVMPN